VQGVLSQDARRPKTADRLDLLGIGDPVFALRDRVLELKAITAG
jgi:hypothetical protein